MGDETASVTGKSGLFEGAHLQIFLKRRGTGGWQCVSFGLAILGLALLLAGIALMAFLQGEGKSARLIILFLYAVVAMTFVAWLNRIVKRRMARRWYMRGAPVELTLSFAVEPVGLRISSEIGTSILYWPYLSEIAPSGDYLMLIGANHIYALPRRFFSTRIEERAFLTAVVEHMEPEARARSRKSRNFRPSARRTASSSASSTKGKESSTGSEVDATCVDKKSA